MLNICRPMDIGGDINDRNEQGVRPAEGAAFSKAICEIVAKVFFLTLVLFVVAKSRQKKRI